MQRSWGQIGGKNPDFIIPSVDGFGLAERARLLTGFWEGYKGSQDFWVGG